MVSTGWHSSTTSRRRAPDENIWEAMGIATWVAAKTDRLKIGHLVLCDAFRHPAVLAKQAVTLSEASGGRFELGLGAGSWPAEFARFDVGQQDPVARVEQLGPQPGVDQAVLGGRRDLVGPRSISPAHASDTAGPGRQWPPDDGTGSQIRGLVEPPGEPSRPVPRLAPAAGPARISVQQMVGFIRTGGDPAKRARGEHPAIRTAGAGLVCGDCRRVDRDTSVAWPPRGSSAFTCGSPTSPRRNRLPNSANR